MMGELTAVRIIGALVQALITGIDLLPASRFRTEATDAALALKMLAARREHELMPEPGQ
jgi:hypothetical protein